MKRPLAYITAAWCGEDYKNTEQAARYCRAVYEAGFSPICPTLYLPLFLNDAVPEEHKSGIDMSRDLLRRSHVLVVCGHNLLRRWKRDYAPKTPEGEWHPLFVEALQKQAHVEYLLDVLLFSDMGERAALIASYGKEVRSLERRMADLAAGAAAGRDGRHRSRPAAPEH